MRGWKVVGLAAFMGVATTGVLVARSQRLRRAYTPEQVRQRLRARLDQAPPAPSAPE